MARTSKEVRDDNKIFRFQVEVLWKNLKEERTRRDQAVHFSRESSRIKQGIIDELKAENKRLVAALELSDGSSGWTPKPGDVMQGDDWCDHYGIPRPAKVAKDLACATRLLKLASLTGDLPLSKGLKGDIRQFLGVGNDQAH